MIQYKSKGPGTRGANDVNSRLRAREDEVQCLSSSSEAGKKKKQNYSFLWHLFCSHLNRLDDTHLQWGGPSTLLSHPIQILMSSRSTITDTPRNVLNLSTSWPVELTQKINNHDCIFIPFFERTLRPKSKNFVLYYWLLYLQLLGSCLRYTKCNSYLLLCSKLP